MSGNDDYKFGITKQAAKMAQDGAEEVGKVLTGAAKEADKAADATAEVAAKESKKVKEAADAAGQIITEDEEYAFGDITKKAVGDAKKKMADISTKVADYYDPPKE